MAALQIDSAMGCTSSSNVSLESDTASDHSAPAIGHGPDGCRMHNAPSALATERDDSDEERETDDGFEAIGPGPGSHHPLSLSNNSHSKKKDPQQVTCSPAKEPMDVFSASPPPSCCQTLPPHADQALSESLSDPSIQKVESKSILIHLWKDGVPVGVLEKEKDDLARAEAHHQPQSATHQVQRDAPTSAEHGVASPLVRFEVGNDIKTDDEQEKENERKSCSDEQCSLNVATPSSDLVDTDDSLRDASITSSSAAIAAHGIAPHQLMKWVRLKSQG